MTRHFGKLAIALCAIVFTTGPIVAQIPTTGVVLNAPASIHRVADLRFSNGNTVQFYVDDETKDVFIAETTPAGPSELFMVSGDERTALEHFLNITPAWVPVPKALIHAEQPGRAPQPGDGAGLLEPASGAAVSGPQATDSQQIPELLSSRVLADQLEAPLYLSLPTSKSVARAAATGGSCGPEGNAYFQENHCNTLGGPGYGEGEGHCDSGAASWIQRTSGEGMRHTYTRIAACDAYGKVIHSRTQYGDFEVKFEGVAPPNTVQAWWTSTSGITHTRRARFERIGDSGYVRGWTHFFKQLAE